MYRNLFFSFLRSFSVTFTFTFTFTLTLTLFLSHPFPLCRCWLLRVSAALKCPWGLPPPPAQETQLLKVPHRHHFHWPITTSAVYSLLDRSYRSFKRTSRVSRKWVTDVANDRTSGKGLQLRVISWRSWRNEGEKWTMAIFISRVSVVRRIFRGLWYVAPRCNMQQSCIMLQTQ